MTPEGRSVLAASPIVDGDARVAGRQVCACTHCGAGWLWPDSGDAPPTCPLCGVGSLRPRAARVQGEPELAVPFAIEPGEAARRVRDFVGDAVMPVAESWSANFWAASALFRVGSTTSNRCGTGMTSPG